MSNFSCENFIKIQRIITSALILLQNDKMRPHPQTVPRRNFAHFLFLRFFYLIFLHCNTSEEKRRFIEKKKMWLGSHYRLVFIVFVSIRGFDFVSHLIFPNILLKHYARFIVLLINLMFLLIHATFLPFTFFFSFLILFFFWGSRTVGMASFLEREEGWSVGSIGMFGIKTLEGGFVSRTLRLKWLSEQVTAKNLL